MIIFEEIRKWQKEIQDKLIVNDYNFTYESSRMCPWLFYVNNEKKQLQLNTAVLEVKFWLMANKQSILLLEHFREFLETETSLMKFNSISIDDGDIRDWEITYFYKDLRRHSISLVR